MNTTEAFMLAGPRTGGLARWPLPNGDVTIEVEACALCQRDTGIWTGEIARQFPDVLGHEVVGRVVQCAPDAAWRSGTRVAGMGNQAMARHMRIPAWQVAPVPQAGPHLALVEPLACAVNACSQDPSSPDSPAVVFGLGLLGQLISALLASAGRTVLGVDTDDARLSVAAATGTEVAEPDAPAVAEAIRDAGVAYECTGRQEVLWRLSTELPPSSGLVLVAHHRRGDLPAGVLLDQWHVRGIAIRNAVPRTAPSMAACVRAAAALPVDLTRYTIHTADLKDAARLLDTWPTGAVMRNVLIP